LFYFIKQGDALDDYVKSLASSTSISSSTPISSLEEVYKLLDNIRIALFNTSENIEESEGATINVAVLDEKSKSKSKEKPRSAGEKKKKKKVVDHTSSEDVVDIDNTTIPSKKHNSVTLPSSLIHRLLRISFITRHYTLFDELIHILDIYSVFLHKNNILPSSLYSLPPPFDNVLPYSFDKKDTDSNEVVLPEVLSSTHPPSLLLLAEAALFASIFPILPSSADLLPSFVNNVNQDNSVTNTTTHVKASFSVPLPLYDYFSSDNICSKFPPRYRIVRLPFSIPFSHNSFHNEEKNTEKKEESDTGDGGDKLENALNKDEILSSSISSPSNQPSSYLLYLPFHLSRVSLALQIYLQPFFSSLVGENPSISNAKNYISLYPLVNSSHFDIINRKISLSSASVSIVVDCLSLFWKYVYDYSPLSTASNSFSSFSISSSSSSSSITTFPPVLLLRFLFSIQSSLSVLPPASVPPILSSSSVLLLAHLSRKIVEEEEQDEEDEEFLLENRCSDEGADISKSELLLNEEAVKEELLLRRDVEESKIIIDDDGVLYTNKDVFFYLINFVFNIRKIIMLKLMKKLIMFMMEIQEEERLENINERKDHALEHYMECLLYMMETLMLEVITITQLVLLRRLKLLI
jgi:hypothetical protein